MKSLTTCLLVVVSIQFFICENSPNLYKKFNQFLKKYNFSASLLKNTLQQITIKNRTNKPKKIKNLKK